MSRDEYLVHLSRYIHLDPVMDGLVERAEDWDFSSYQEYIGQRNETLPRREIVLSQFGSADDYREFVESYVADDRVIIADLLFGETRHQTSEVSETSVVSRGSDAAIVIHYAAAPILGCRR